MPPRHPSRRRVDRGARARRVRRAVLAVGGLIAVVLGAGTAGVLAAASDPVSTRDARGDVAGPLDLQRVSLSRASDGRLRAAVTLAAALQPKDMLARSGPPGSICLRVWTARDPDPRSSPPDRLVCITARSDDELRGSVLEQREGRLPRRTGPAAVSRTKSRRSVIVRVSQSALGRPARIRFGVESTSPGCDRTSCVDTAPAAPVTLRFRLR